MLCIRRKVGERIIINDELIIEVLDRQGKQLQLGFIGERSKYKIKRMDEELNDKTRR